MDSREAVVEGTEQPIDPATLGQSMQPLVERTVVNILHFIGPRVGEVVSDLMVEKYGGLSKIENLTRQAKDIAGALVMIWWGVIMEYIHDDNHLEERFPELGGMLLSVVQDSVDATVEGLLEKVDTGKSCCCSICPCCACCCAPETEPRDIIQKACDIVSSEVREKIKAGLDNAEGFDLPEHTTRMVRERMSPMVDAWDAKTVAAAPVKIAAPALQTMGASAIKARTVFAKIQGEQQTA